MSLAAPALTISQPAQMVEIETMDCVRVRCIDADNDRRGGMRAASVDKPNGCVFSAELSR
jgi:hypothetical protein